MCLMTKREAECAAEPFRVWKAVLVENDQHIRLETAGGSPGWSGVWGYNFKVFPFGEVCKESGPDAENGRIGEGWFHSFSSLGDCLQYAYGNFRRGVFNGSVAISRCTIPAGARYHVGKYQVARVYASDAIVAENLMSVEQAKREWIAGENYENPKND